MLVIADIGKNLAEQSILFSDLRECIARPELINKQASRFYVTVFPLVLGPVITRVLKLYLKFRLI